MAARNHRGSGRLTRAATTEETKSYFEEVKFPDLNVETK